MEVFLFLFVVVVWFCFIVVVMFLFACYLLFFAVLEIKPKALHLVGKYFTNEL